MLYHTPQLLSSQPFYAPLSSFTHSLVTTIIMSEHKYLKLYNSYDIYCANIIKNYRYYYGLFSPYEDVIRTVSCDYIALFSLLFFLSVSVPILVCAI